MLFCFRFNKKALNTVLFSFELHLVQDFSFPFCLLFAVRGRLYVTLDVCWRGWFCEAFFIEV